MYYVYLFYPVHYDQPGHVNAHQGQLSDVETPEDGCVEEDGHNLYLRTQGKSENYEHALGLDLGYQ